MCCYHILQSKTAGKQLINWKQDNKQGCPLHYHPLPYALCITIPVQGTVLGKKKKKALKQNKTHTHTNNHPKQNTNLAGFDHNEWISERLKLTSFPNIPFFHTFSQESLSSTMHCPQRLICYCETCEGVPTAAPETQSYKGLGFIPVLQGS